MTGLSAGAVMAASTDHRAECQLDGQIQRYRIHMVPFGSETPKRLHTAAWVNPTARLCDQFQQVSAANITPMSSLSPWEYLHTQPFQCWFILFVHSFSHSPKLSYVSYSSLGLPQSPITIHMSSTSPCTGSYFSFHKSVVSVSALSLWNGRTEN